ncbi:MAG: substrate-binding domain-containing protein, partial [Lachnospiraceae bacterium]|nr:substrate-binding domain-containing protein [Lachnospiraceae bacterium]
WDRAKGQQIAQDALTQFGNQIEVIFCNNDDMALGAKASIEAAGRKVGTDIYLVGVDALAEAVQAVMDGAMTGTVLNDHVGQSHTAADCAIDAANGKSLQLYNWVDYVKVTPENASQYK